jgi:rhodanese-related sulfurtransferase
LRIAASAFVLVFVLVGFLTAALAPVSVYVDVSVSQAKQMIDSNPELVILDVRTQSEYDAGHIQNATLIPVSELGGRLGELDKNKEILVYCASGGRSATASQTLVDNGFSKVYNMLGGIAAWISAGYWVELIHNGDLIIDGTQTFVIENCTYIQTGNIIAKESARLVIRNANVSINMTYGAQYNIVIQNNATVEMNNSVITAGFGFGLNFLDQASATFYGSEFYLWIICWGNSKVIFDH